LRNEPTAELVGALPLGRAELVIDLRATGADLDVAVGLRDQDDPYRTWDPPAEVWRRLSAAARRYVPRALVPRALVLRALVPRAAGRGAGLSHRQPTGSVSAMMMPEGPRR
jgi:hypothetical protein